MSMTINGNQQLEIRDATGGLVALVVSAQSMRDLVAERDELRRQVERLQAQLTTAGKAQAELQAERDEYARALEAIAENRELALDRKEMARLEREGLSFDTIIGEVERIVQSKPPAGA